MYITITKIKINNTLSSPQIFLSSQFIATPPETIVILIFNITGYFFLFLNVIMHRIILDIHFMPGFFVLVWFGFLLHIIFLRLTHVVSNLFLFLSLLLSIAIVWLYHSWSIVSCWHIFALVPAWGYYDSSCYDHS